MYKTKVSNNVKGTLIHPNFLYQNETGKEKRYDAEDIKNILMKPI